MNKIFTLINLFLFLCCFACRVSAQITQTVTSGSSTQVINFPGAGCVFDWENDNTSIGLLQNGTGNIQAFTAINTGKVGVKATITAVAQPTGFAYIPNMGDGTVSVVDLTSNKTVSAISVDKDPVWVTVSPDGKTAYVSNETAQSISVINTTTNKVTTTIATGGITLGTVTSLDGSKLYVACTGTNNLLLVNTSDNSIIQKIALNASPFGITMSPDGRFIYTANLNDNNISVVSTATNTLITNIAVGTSPSALVLNPDGSRLYVTNQNSGSISIINTAANQVIDTSVTGQTSADIAISLDGQWLYTTNFVAGTVSVISTASNKIVSSINVGDMPVGISISSGGSRLYISNQGSNNVSVINTFTNKVIATVAVGASPNGQGHFIKNGLDCTDTPLRYYINVNPAGLQPSIFASAVTGNISSCAGTVSQTPALLQFKLSASNLAEDIVAVAPAGFEFSLSPNTGYGTTLLITPDNGSVAEEVIYIRSSAAAAVGNISGDVILTSGSVKEMVPLTATINPLPTVGKVPDQVKSNGQTTDAVNFSGNGNAFLWSNDNPAIGLPATGTGDIGAFTAVNTGKTPITAKIKVTPLLAGFVFMANFNGGTVSMINTATNKVMYTLTAGANPIGVSANPKGTRVYVTNFSSNSITVIDVASHSVLATITVGKSPNGVTVSPDGSKVYVSNSNDNSLSVIDAATNEVVATVKVGNYPIGITVSKDGSKIYVADDLANKITVLNAANNAFIKDIPVGNGPSNTVLSPDGGRLYVANSSGNSISVINTLTDDVIGTIATESIVLGLAISPDGTRLYANNNPPTNSLVYVFDTGNFTTLNKIAIGSATEGLAISPDGSRVYVSNIYNNSVKVIDTQTEKVVADVPAGQGPSSVGNFVTAGSPCDGEPITFTITVKPTAAPTIVATGTLVAITSTYGSPSAAPPSFAVSGSDLTTSILVTPPEGFEVSLDDVNFSPVLTIGGQGTVAQTIIYVRLASKTDVGSYVGDIVLTSKGAGNVVVAATGTVKPATVTITANTVHKVYGNTLTGVTGSTAFTQTGLQNSETIGSVSIDYGQGAAAGDAINTYIGSVKAFLAVGGTFKASNYIINYLPGDIVVDAVPVISATGTLQPLVTTYGTPSATTSFTVSGANLSLGILVTPPVGLEVSTDNITFTKTVTIGTSGLSTSTIIYFRLASVTNAGSYPGNIVLTSQGALDVNVPMVSNTVNRAPLIITANNVNKTYGDALSGGTGFTSFTWVGLQNSETIGSVSVTYASGAAATDNVGVYSGSVSLDYAVGGTFKPTNYNIDYAHADIMVNKANLTVIANSKNRKYGEPNPDLDITYIGFRNFDGISQLTVLPSVTTSANVLSPVGQYVIKAGGAQSGNYDFTYIDGVLTVEPVKLDIVIPNAFSPNGDGSNDIWQIKNLDAFPGCTVNIFNRYGAKLFSSVGYTVPWDGKYNGIIVSSGTYYYVINLKNGSSPMSGYVIIVR